MNIGVPVVRANQLRYVLFGAVKPDAIRDVIVRQQVPESWVISVFDGRGMRVARSRMHEQNLGTPAAPSLQQLMAGGAPEGTGFTYSLEGDHIQTTFTRLPDSGWSVAVGIAPTALLAGTYGSLAALGGGIVLSILLGMLAALLVARSINRPIATLRVAAQALGRSESPATPDTEIQEIQEVADALVGASPQRQRDEAEREQLLAAERAARTAAEQARCYRVRSNRRRRCRRSHRSWCRRSPTGAGSTCWTSMATCSARSPIIPIRRNRGTEWSWSTGCVQRSKRPVRWRGPSPPASRTWRASIRPWHTTRYVTAIC